jgi:hypothetical protein
MAVTAIFGEISQQRVHGGEVGRVDERPTLPFTFQQPGLLKRFQVKRQRGRGQVKALTDRSRRHSVRSDFHQIAKNIQASLLSQGTECCNNEFFFHISNFIDLWK